MNPRAFTLIELLIVVAIIAILAAIAVPNFLEAQTRSKVSRAQNDIRTIQTGLESYRVDWNRYPPEWDEFPGGSPEWRSRLGDGAPFPRPRTAVTGQDWYYMSYTALAPLTTPVSFLTTLPNDPFFSEPAAYTYVFFGPSPAGTTNLSGTRWLLSSAGTDVVVGDWRQFGPGTPGSGYLVLYDPTNGTVSRGDIWRTNNNRDYAPFTGF